jgi:septin family protein
VILKKGDKLTKPKRDAVREAVRERVKEWEIAVAKKKMRDTVEVIVNDD